MKKFQRSVRLLKLSLGIINRERKLLLFPLITLGLFLGIMLFFFAPVFFASADQPVYTAGHPQAAMSQIARPANVERASFGARLKDYTNLHKLDTSFAEHPFRAIGWVACYVLSMFFGTFVNVAFYHEIMQALNGVPVSIRRGFQCASSRWRAILLWSLFAGLIGYLISAIEQRVGVLGKIIATFVGVAWSVACVFAIPTLVRDPETSNPITLLKRSAATVRRTWGELVIGYARVEFVMLGILTAIILAVFVCGAVVGHNNLFSPSAAFIAIFLAAMVFSSAARMVSAIYQCALYIYATEGVIPESFDQELLDSAWTVK